MPFLSVIMLPLRVDLLTGNKEVDLPDLTVIQLGKNAFSFNEDSVTTALVHVIDLPKLTTITSIPEARNSGTTFMYPRQVTIDSNCTPCVS